MKTGRHESKITLNRQVSRAEGGRTFLFRPFGSRAAGGRRLRRFTVRHAKGASNALHAHLLSAVKRRKRRAPGHLALTVIAVFLLFSARGAGSETNKTQAAAERKDPRQHWAFKPPVRPPAPNLRNKTWVRNPVDSFILARLE